MKMEVEVLVVFAVVVTLAVSSFSSSFSSSSSVPSPPLDLSSPPHTACAVAGLFAA